MTTLATSALDFNSMPLSQTGDYSLEENMQFFYNRPVLAIQFHQLVKTLFTCNLSPELQVTDKIPQP
jgi:hypothetical protein